MCLLHNRITQSCKVKTDIVASPFWTKLQTLAKDSQERCSACMVATKYESY